MRNRRDPRLTAIGQSYASTSLAGEAQGGVMDIDDVFVVRYLDEDGQNDLSLARLMSRPHLARLVGEFLHWIGLGVSHSVRVKKRKLIAYFWKYLDQLENLFGVCVQTFNDIEQHVIDGYQAWLDGNKKYKSPLNIKPGTRRTRYLIIQDLFEWATQSGPYNSLPSQIIFRSHKWAGAHRKTKSAEPLNALAVAKLRRACRAEIRLILETLQHGSEARTTTHVPFLRSESVSVFKDLDVKIAAFAQVAALDCVTGDSFRREYRGLARALRKPYGAINEIAPYLYFTWESIVPFMVLLGLETGYNTSTQCGLAESEVGVHPFWENTIRLSPPKNRANGLPQVRTFPLNPSDPYSVSSLLEEIKKYTAWYRPLALERDRHRLFLVWSGNMGRPPTSLLRDDRSTRTSLDRAMRRFSTRYKLPGLTFSVLRQTVADAIHFISDGDAQAIKTMMGHADISTSERSYNSAGQMARRSSKLANAVRHRQRFIDSHGQIPIESVNTDVPPSAATPGFLCWDIYHSPVLGQKDGRICSAYGCCPDCPLACCRHNDTYAAGRFLQLKKLFEETRDQVDHIRWAAQWHPQYEALLSDWLPKLHPEAIAAAKPGILSPLPRLQ